MYGFSESPGGIAYGGFNLAGLMLLAFWQAAATIWRVAHWSACALMATPLLQPGMFRGN